MIQGCNPPIYWIVEYRETDKRSRIIYSSSASAEASSLERNSLFLVATRALRSSRVSLLAFQRFFLILDGSLLDFCFSGSARIASWAFLYMVST